MKDFSKAKEVLTLVPLPKINEIYAVKKAFSKAKGNLC